MTQELPPPIQLMQMIFGFAVSRAIGVAAELGIADLLADGPESTATLSAQTGMHERSLYRVLRACASVGVFSEDAAKRFSLTPLAEPLLSDVPGSLRAFTTMMTTDWQFETWAHLPYSVRTGEPAFDKVHNMPSFEYFWTHEKAGKVFNDAMTSNSAFSSQAVVEAYDFSSFQTIVDIGGGHGQMLASILKKHPQLKGVLYDIPAVVQEAAQLLRDYEVSERCERVSGDFFQAVPTGGDAYIMKHIIHDWNDEQCITLLSNCRQAMNTGGKVLVVEMVLPEGNEPSLGKLLDLQMLLYLPGCERTAAEYETLFAKAGFVLNSITPTMSPFSIIEGIPR